VEADRRRGDIASPDAIWAADDIDIEVPTKHVLSDRQSMIGIGRLTKPARRNARNPGRFHQPADAMNADVRASVTKRLANAKATCRGFPDASARSRREGLPWQ
jgi:hypothetical protein